jgi:hypothetical protein
MKYQLNGAWPIGQYLIPATTIIDTSAGDDWSRLARGRVPPLNATPLDDEAHKAMLNHYQENHLKFYGVKR